MRARLRGCATGRARGKERNPPLRLRLRAARRSARAGRRGPLGPAVRERGPRTSARDAGNRCDREPVAFLRFGRDGGPADASPRRDSRRQRPPPRGGRVQGVRAGARRGGRTTLHGGDPEHEGCPRLGRGTRGSRRSRRCPDERRGRGDGRVRGRHRPHRGGEPGDGRGRVPAAGEDAPRPGLGDRHQGRRVRRPSGRGVVRGRHGRTAAAGMGRGAALADPGAAAHTRHLSRAAVAMRVERRSSRHPRARLRPRPDGTVGGGCRVPQLGWNRITAPADAVFLRSGIFYFANSYRLEAVPPDWTGAISLHGTRFVAGLERGGVLACQFHPELSGRTGAALLGRWLEQAPAAEAHDGSRARVRLAAAC